LNCKEKFFISKDEFITGLALQGYETLKKLKSKIPALKDELKVKENFKKFYMFLFDYMKGTQKRLDVGKVNIKNY
jgi:hypothetical protein